MTERALHGSLGRLDGDGGMLTGGSLGRHLGGATGAVTGATRGIAPTINGALNQLPLGGRAGSGP